MAAPSLAVAINGLSLKSTAGTVSMTSPSSFVVIEPVTSAYPLSSSSPSSSSLLSNCSSSMSSPPAPFPATSSSGEISALSTPNNNNNNTTSGTSVGGVGCLPTTTSASANGSSTAASGKDSGWLTLEVCREHIRQRCTRSESDCRFAHPPPHVDIQNGRVICCFDSIKGRCQRTDPPCKYLHPPQHLKEQLLQNGRNNLIMKNLQQIQRIHQHATVMPNTSAFCLPVVNPYVVVNPSNWYPSYYNTRSMQQTIAPPTSGHNGFVSGTSTIAQPTATVAPPVEQSVHELENGPVSAAAVDASSFSNGVQTVSPADGQYWTLSPSGCLYAASPMTSSYYSHCSPVYYQNGNYAMPTPAANAVLVPKRTASVSSVVDGPAKNGYSPAPTAAIYPCGSAAYQQMALSSGQVDMPPFYTMAISVPPPVNGFYGC